MNSVIIIIEMRYKMSLLSKNIALYRRKKGYTQKELAEKTGLSRSFISQIENNTNNPSDDTLYKISEVLDASISELKGVYNWANLSILNLLIDLTESSTIKWENIEDPSKVYEYIYIVNIDTTTYKLYVNYLGDTQKLFGDDGFSNDIILEISDSKEDMNFQIKQDGLDESISLGKLKELISCQLRDESPKFKVINNLEKLKKSSSKE